MQFRKRQRGIERGEDTGWEHPEAPGIGPVGDGDNALAAGLEDQRDGHVPRHRREEPVLGGRRGMSCHDTQPLSAIPRTSRANSIDILRVLPISLA